MFGRATIMLCVGPHSSLLLKFVALVVILIFKLIFQMLQYRELLTWLVQLLK